MARGRYLSFMWGSYRPMVRSYTVVPAMTVYVNAKSKADLNRRLEAGFVVVGIEHKLGDETKWPLQSLPDGTVIKIHSNVEGTPYARSYGRWNAKKGRVM